MTYPPFPRLIDLDHDLSLGLSTIPYRAMANSITSFSLVVLGLTKDACDDETPDVGCLGWGWTRRVYWRWLLLTLRMVPDEISLGFW